MVLASMFPCETWNASTQGQERKKVVFGSSCGIFGLYGCWEQGWMVQ